MGQPKYEPRIWTGGFKRALVLESPHASLDDLLGDLGIQVVRIDSALDEHELIERVQDGGFQLIFKRSRTPITRTVIEAAPDLFGILLCCIGDDSVDKQAAADHGVLVCNDPISNGRSVAELVLGQMIGLARRVFDAAREMDAHQFVKTNRARYELRGKTLGVLGLGNIGRQVAQLCEALGMDVCFYDTREVAVEVGAAMGWRGCATIEELFRRANVVSVHVSASDQRGISNQGLIAYEHFKAMNADGKPGPRIFMNAARGHIHSAVDLARAVAEEHVETAYVDVFEQEPRSASEDWQNPYAPTSRILTTPHIGAATVEAQPRIAVRIANTVRMWQQTGSVRDCVFRGGREIRTDPSSGRTILTVVHSDQRGTKKAVDDAIYEAGASNLQSAHRDFPRYGIAYDLNVLDRPLSDEHLAGLVGEAVDLTGDARAIRSIRQFQVPDATTR